MEKRFKPSRKRLKKAYQDGNLPKSQYFSQCVVLACSFIGLYCLTKSAWVGNRMLLEYILFEGLRNPSAAFSAALHFCMQIILVCLSFGVLAALVIEFMQIGFLFEPQLLLPQIKRLDPVSGFARIFSNLGSIWQVLLRAGLLSLVCAGIFYYRIDLIIGLSFLPFAEKISGFEKLFWEFSCYGLGLLLLTAVFDYWRKRKQWFSQVGMSLEDLKQEHREEEGDPLTKSLRRAEHQALLRQNIINRVRKSKVIIVEKA